MLAATHVAPHAQLRRLPLEDDVEVPQLDERGAAIGALQATLACPRIVRTEQVAERATAELVGLLGARDPQRLLVGEQHRAVLGDGECHGKVREEIAEVLLAGRRSLECGVELVRSLAHAQAQGQLAPSRRRHPGVGQTCDGAARNDQREHEEQTRLVDVRRQHDRQERGWSPRTTRQARLDVKLVPARREVRVARRPSRTLAPLAVVADELVAERHLRGRRQLGRRQLDREVALAERQLDGTAGLHDAVPARVVEVLDHGVRWELLGPRTLELEHGDACHRGQPDTTIRGDQQRRRARHVALDGQHAVLLAVVDRHDLRRAAGEVGRELARRDPVRAAVGGDPVVVLAPRDLEDLPGEQALLRPEPANVRTVDPGEPAHRTDEDRAVVDEDRAHVGLALERLRHEPFVRDEPEHGQTTDPDPVTRAILDDQIVRRAREPVAIGDVDEVAVGSAQRDPARRADPHLPTVVEHDRADVGRGQAILHGERIPLLARAAPQPARGADP